MVCSFFSSAKLSSSLPVSFFSRAKVTTGHLQEGSMSLSSWQSTDSRSYTAESPGMAGILLLEISPSPSPVASSATPVCAKGEGVTKTNPLLAQAAVLVVQEVCLVHCHNYKTLVQGEDSCLSSDRSMFAHKTTAAASMA